MALCRRVARLLLQSSLSPRRSCVACVQKLHTPHRNPTSTVLTIGQWVKLTGLQPAVRLHTGHRSQSVEAGFVCRLQGLPYTATEQEVVQFLSGSDEKSSVQSVHLVRNVRGEAFVEFHAEEAADLAVGRNNQCMGHRFIGVSRCSVDHMTDVVSQQEPIIQLRGLPYSCTDEQVRHFFNDSESSTIKSISFTCNERGDTFVEFQSEESITHALNNHADQMDGRNINVFRTSQLEMDRTTSQQDPTVVKLRGLPFDCSTDDITHFFTGLEIVPNGIILPEGREGRNTGIAYVQFQSAEMTAKALKKDKELIGHRYVDICKSSIRMALDQRDTDIHDRPRGGRDTDVHDRRGRPHTSDANWLIMRGLPFQATERDIYDFFSPVRPVKVEMKYQQDGRLSGVVNVKFASQKEVMEALKKHRTNMYHRYIELFLKSDDRRFATARPTWTAGNFEFGSSGRNYGGQQ